MTTITLSGGAALTTEQKTALRVEIGAPTATDVTAAASNAIAAHASAADPHPQYMTQSEGDQRYAPAGITGATNLTATASPTGITVNSDTGTDAPLPLADSTNAGLMAPEQVTKLGGVADGATANATDAQLRDRATHTGAQAISTVTGLQDALDGKATAAQGAKADSALQPGSQLTQASVTAATAAGVTLLGAADAAAQRAALGLGTAATTAAMAYATAAQGAKADAALVGTAGAMATMLEASATTAPADLARIQASVSGYPVAVRQVATRCIFPTTLIGGVKQFNSRTGHYMRSGVCTSVRLAYANFYSVYESAPGGAATVEAAIEYPAGTYTRVTWGGSNTCTIADGQMGALSDAITVSIPRNALFWVRTFAQNPAGMVYHGDGVPAGAFDFGEFAASGLTSKVMGGSLGPAAAVVRPSLIVGPSDCPSFGYLGDSISEGLSDTFDDLSNDLGVVQRMIGGRFPYVGAGNSGTTCQAFCDNSAKRAAAMKPYITHLVNEYGVNDLSDAGSYQNVLTQLLRVPGIFPGKKIYQCTIVPKSTSTDSWATVANQTAVNSGNRASLNKSITAGLVGYTAPIDIAAVCESSPWSGVWRVDLGQPTADGLHPKTAIYRAVRMSGVFDRIPL